MAKLGLNFNVPILTSNQADYLHNYLRTKKRNYFMHYFDGEFLDAAKEVLNVSGNRALKQELIKSCKSKKCSKRFKDWDKVYENFDHYVAVGVNRPDYSWLENFKVAKRLLVDQIRVTKLERVKLFVGMDTSQIWTNEDASAGFVGIHGDGTKKENEEECILMALKLEGLIREGVNFDQIFVPNMSFSRSQMSHYVEKNSFSEKTIEYKNRLVWCADGGTETLEASYSQPLIKHLVRWWNQYAGGKDPGSLRMLIRKGEGKPGLSIDYSKFDQTIQSWLIREAFDVVKLFYSEEDAIVLDWICYNFINTYLAIPGVGLVQKHRGIPSGSGFTQVIGSMCNALMFYTYLSHVVSVQDATKYDACVFAMTNSRSPKIASEMTCMFMGDDCMIQSYMKFNLEDLRSYMLKVFGVSVSSDKCEVWDALHHPIFLKREWQGDGEYRNLLELLVNTSHPERERKYLDEDGSRKFSGWHIMYGLFVTFRKAFPGIQESWLVEKMHSNGGLEVLSSLRRNDLPGSLWAIQMDNPYYLYNRALSVARRNGMKLRSDQLISNRKFNRL